MKAKEYDVTIRVRVAELGPSGPTKGEPLSMQQIVHAAVHLMLQDLAGHSTTRAAQVTQLDVDPLP